MTHHTFHLNPATVAHIAATLLAGSENLRTDGSMIDLGLKPNRYRELRVQEMTCLAVELMTCADKTVRKYEAAIFQEQTP